MSDPVSALLASAPYARFLGLGAKLEDGELTVVMPFADHLIGNPMLPALHGGTTAAMMELTAAAQVALRFPRPNAPRPINVSVAYLRSGRPVDTFARARINRAGARTANVHVEAWQDDPQAPIAMLTAHFLLSSPDGVSPSRHKGTRDQGK